MIFIHSFFIPQIDIYQLIHREAEYTQCNQKQQFPEDSSTFFLFLSCHLSLTPSFFHSVVPFPDSYFYTGMVRNSSLKMNRDRTDLAVGTDTHRRSPDTNPGSYDTVQVPFFQITTGIFPHQFDSQISREHLAIMGMST